MIEQFRNEEAEQLLQEIQDSFVFEEDIRKHYIEFEEPIRKPDLLGKTVQVTALQYSEVYTLLEQIAMKLEMTIPDVYVIEDYYYGTQSFGIESPWIEISAKTISDLTYEELVFVLGKEMATIKLGYTECWTLMNKQKRILEEMVLPGKDITKEVLTIKFAKWQRLSHYTTDRVGLWLCKDIKGSIDAILLMILNSRRLTEKLHLSTYLKQAEEINFLNNKVHQYTKADETIPYGPFRIKQLLAYYNQMNKEVLG